MQTPQNMRQYDATMRMRISLAVAFLIAPFTRFFCRSLGLINRLNPYVVRESYLNGLSYGENECKSRSREVINENCAYYVGLTLDTLVTVSILYRRFCTVTCVLKT